MHAVSQNETRRTAVEVSIAGALLDVQAQSERYAQEQVPLRHGFGREEPAPVDTVFEHQPW